jgi:predicted dehydrogenase
MLATLFGPDIRRVWCTAGRRVQLTSLSEDVAIIVLEWADGMMAVADVPCGVNTELFATEVFGSETSLKLSIPKGDIQDVLGGAVGAIDHLDEFGYTGTIKAFVEMCRTRQMPVPFDESAALARVLLAARASAASGEAVDMQSFG